ncbi:MAG: NAD-dependent epimerase/dehydratase family protein [Cyanobacteria bacterium K_Offshore_surface_m2_239]|nr:NAD-dependent epimerase/dehydratase family protein [Cyanobacteria bacterium K_Offshore_surface_m2_239]
MDVLVMGGTRFVGRPVVARLLAEGHAITIFTRGRQPVPEQVRHVRGDRTSDSDLAALDGETFDVIIDSSGRTLDDTRQVLAHTGAPRHRLVYVSSAGVYADSAFWPLDEDAPIDPASRHAGKAETEAWLRAEGIPFTSFRPTYIIGPGNYNPIERWFFDRLLHDRPVPLPGDGQWITQLGDVRDLAEAMTRCLEVETACNRIYNCSGRQGVTLRGLVETAAIACGKDPTRVEIRGFDPSRLEPKARKAFPLRLSHFLTDTHRLQRELAWQPRFDLLASLRDAHQMDVVQQTLTAPDFQADDALLAG